MSNYLTDSEDSLVQQFYENLVLIKDLPKHGTFSVDLDDYMNIQSAAIKSLKVPWIVRKYVDEIYRRGLERTGIFRVPGSYQLTQDLSDAFERGLSPDLSEHTIETLSSGLKRYLRFLPHPLCSDNTPEQVIEKRFVEIMQNYHDTQDMKVLNEIKETLAEISEYRYNTLKEIFFLLYHVYLHSEVNLMNSHNLGTIFGSMVDILSSIMNESHKAEFCELLIEHYETIFMKDILEPCLTVPDDQKQKGIQIHNFGGTYLSRICKYDDKAETVLEVMIHKMMRINPNLNYASCFLYEISDRVWRRIQPEEYISGINERDSIILLSDKFEPEELNGIEIDISVLEKFIYTPTTEGKDVSSEEDVPNHSSSVTLSESAPRKKQFKRKSEPKRLSAVNTDNIERNVIKIKKKKSYNSEIIHNEIMYVMTLSCIVQDYVEPLKRKLGSVVAEKIFGNIKKICRAHDRFINYLYDYDFEEAIFITNQSFLLYKDYFKNLNNALITLKKKQKLKQELFIACTVHSVLEYRLMELLIFPLLYFSQYKPLFMDIVQNEKNKSKDTSAIQKMIMIIINFNTGFTLTKTFVVNHNMINQIQSRITNLHFPLLAPFRKFTREGIVDVKNHSEKKRIRSAEVYLFSDIIVVCKKDKFDCFIPLLNCDKIIKNNSLEIVLICGHLKLKLQFMDELKYYDWELDIRLNIDKLENIYSSLKDFTPADEESGSDSLETELIEKLIDDNIANIRKNPT
eukprot:TRINITY_DN3775_c0_g1_i1.p1 TRINITY_DN3775_c0_g1~~TRINITY_DN3775_c0_g1_i1.p1  ORF type:complete len:760 (-),score=139.93 TRINITY_DN3775_c0_g1_i1:23-2242(-)